MLRRANQSLNSVYYQGSSAARKELYDLAKASIKDGEQSWRNAISSPRRSLTRPRSWRPSWPAGEGVGVERVSP